MTERLTREQVQAHLDGSPFIAFLGLTVTGMDAAAGAGLWKVKFAAVKEKA